MYRARPFPSIIAAAAGPAFWLLGKAQFLALGSTSLIARVDAHRPGGYFGLGLLVLATAVSVAVMAGGAVSAFRSRIGGEDTTDFAKQSLVILGLWLVAAALPAAPL